MDFDSLPEDNAPSNASQSVPQPSAPLKFEDLPEDTNASTDQDSLGQKVLAGVEGVAHGFAGPVATYAEKRLSEQGIPGLSPEEQQARESAHPYIHGAGTVAGTIGGLTSGVGELGLLSKGAEAVLGGYGLAKEATVAAKVGRAALKGFIEMGGIGAGDEVSKHILGQSDPEAPVASALAHIGANGIFGALTGGALTLGGIGAGSAIKKIGENKYGAAIGQFLEDFGNRWKFNQENPNVVDSIYNEVKCFHEATSDAASDVYGSQGLKSQAIQKLTNNVTKDQILSHMDDVRDVFNSIPKEIKAEPLFATALTDWSNTVSKEGATPADIFKATDTLKRQFQEYGEYNKAFVSVRDAPFVNAARQVGSGLKEALEDSKVWNEAGTLQKGVNEAFSQYINPLKDFRSKFTTKVQGVHIVDPQKIKTYVNQLGKTGADITEEIRPQMMKNYIDAADKYRNKISDLYHLKGVESPISPASLNITKNSYGSSLSPGGKFADEVFKGGIGKVTEHAAAAAGFGIANQLGAGGLGEFGGYMLGKALGEKLVPIADKTIGMVAKKYLVPATVKALEMGRPAAIGEVLEHAGNIAKGNSAMQNGVDALFTGAKLGSPAFFSDAHGMTREKIKKFISQGGLNQQIENSLQKTNPVSPEPVPHYAEGGLIESQNSPVKKDKDPDSNDTKLSEVYPEQTTLMSMAKGRVANYLNSVRPIETPSALPFDHSHKDPQAEKSYERAITIADKPLSILHEIKKGTIEPEHINHMKQMWPEVYNQVSQKITQKMMESKLNKENMPPYHVRQSMAMFLGSPLDSSMTPQGIQAAQSVFANQKAAAQQTPPNKTAKNTSKLGKMADRFQTGGQAAASRQVSQTK